jgi:aspartate/methionine/tyrosine aminotransferase
VIPLPLTKLLIRIGLGHLVPGLRGLRNGGAALLRCSDQLLTAPLVDLERLANAWAPEDPEIIDLSQGSPRFDLLASGSTKLPADRRGFPAVGGLPELRRAVADKLRVENRVAVDADQEVLVTPGGLGAFQTVLDALVNRGDTVVLCDPTSPIHPLAVRARQARVRWLQTWIENGRTRFRVDQLRQALRGARLMVLTSPANPTGSILAPEDVEQVAWWATKYDVLLFSDEVFERYYYEGEAVSVGAMPGARDRTLTAGSVSKGYALTWARVGWLAGPRNLLRPCAVAAALHRPFVPTLCQQIALAALQTEPAAFAPVLDALASGRRYSYERLRGLDLNPSWPAGGFFLWVPVWELGLSGRAFAGCLLREKRVLVTPGDLFGPSGAGHIRLSYAADDGRLHEGFERIGAFLGTATEPTARQAA